MTGVTVSTVPRALPPPPRRWWLVRAVRLLVWGWAMNGHDGRTPTMARKGHSVTR
jgi:hypothetical protein